MSKGNIKKPRRPDLPDNLHKKPMEDFIYHVVQTCEVEVEDSEWEESDKKLQEELNTLDAKQKEDIKSLETKLTDINQRLGDNQGNLSEAIQDLGAKIESLKKRKPLELKVQIDNSKSKDLGKQHNQFPLLLSVLATKLNAYVVGPSGAGKTYAAKQVAKALNVSFYYTGAIASEFKLTGFIDAQGRIVSTEFRKAFENGGLFLFDEIDASYPQAVLAFNAALANDYMDFPDKRVPRHKNFYCIAAANTYGQGADRQYIGRNQLDAASLDRFVFIDWHYDENLERAIAGNDEWTDYIQKMRKYIESQKIRHVLSPRASIFGAKLLANGIEREVVKNTIVWKGIDESVRNKIVLNIYPKQQVIAKHKGSFVSEVKLKSKVKKGDILGTIQMYHHTDKNKVLSPCNGTVLVLSKNKKVEMDEILFEIKLEDND